MTNKRVIKRELIIWLQYFIIAFIAAAMAENASTTRLLGGEGGNNPGNFDSINFWEMILSMWHTYYRRWLLIFLTLSAVRFLVLFILNRRGER